MNKDQNCPQHSHIIFRLKNDFFKKIKLNRPIRCAVLLFFYCKEIKREKEKKTIISISQKDIIDIII